MSGRIRIDVRDYLKLIEGLIPGDLRSLLERGKLSIPGPGESPTVTIRKLEIPRLTFARPPLDADLPDESGENGEGNPGDIGIGKFPGKPGTILGPVNNGDGDGNGEGEEGKGAGKGRGEGGVRVQIPSEEFKKLLAEILQLPRIKPKGTRQIEVEQDAYTEIHRVGPQSRLSPRRTIKKALIRSIASGSPTIVPIRRDMRYRDSEVVMKPENNAVIIYAMDVSGSVDEEMRQIVYYYCGLASWWLSANYKGLVEVWIVHDGEADKVSKKEFFETQRSGGTVSSSAHKLALDIIESEYPAEQWNIYMIYISDGLNFDSDNPFCLKLIDEQLVPIVNMYAYVEIDTSRPWLGSGPGVFSNQHTFKALVDKSLGAKENVATARLTKIGEVPDALKSTFGKGR